MRQLIDKQRLKICVIATTVFMLASYMYAYTNGSFLFDASFIYRGEEPFIVRSDKWVSPLLGMLDAHINEPWLAGIWSIIFMIISTYCIVDVLKIHSKFGIILLAGLCSTQTSIICQQEYIGGNYTGECALMFACLAIWFLVIYDRNIWLKIILCTVCIAISAGIYGAYISIVPSLLIVLLIIDIVKGNSARKNWIKTVFYASVFLVGMILYYIILRCTIVMTGSQLQAYMGEDNISSISGIHGMILSIPKAYFEIIMYYLGRTNYLPGFMNKMMFFILILGLILGCVLFIKNRKKIDKKLSNIILLLILLGLLPLAINFIYVMSSGHVHFLMIFTYVVPFLVVVKEVEICLNRKRMREYFIAVLTAVITVFFVYYSIVMSNAVMVHLNHMFVEAQTICTNMIMRIENCEGFKEDEDVVLIGALQYNNYYQTTKETNAEILKAYLGPGNSNNVNGVNWGSWLSKYMTNILNSSLQYTYYDSLDKYQRDNDLSAGVLMEIKEMPSYPLLGSVKKIDNTIYVNLGELGE